MFQFEIGASVSDTEMNAQLKQGLGEFSFPKSVTVENLMPIQIVDTTIGVVSLDSNLKIGGKTRGEFEFPTFSHLARFADNMLTVAKLNGFETALLLSVDELAVDEPESKTESAGKKTRKSKAEVLDMQETTEE